MKKVRIGLVGTGFIADWHYKGFLKNPDAEIMGITRDYYGDEKDINRQRDALNTIAREYNIKPYDNYDELLHSNEIDALVIGSINPLHYDQIRKAIAVGKPLLVEKPVLTDLNELDEIQKLIEGNKFKLFPAHNFVYRGAVQNAKKLIDHNKLGTIIHASFIISHTISENHAHGWRSIKKHSCGGALMDSGHHLVYQLLYLLGRPVKLHGFTSSMVLKQMECEDTAQVSLIYPDGSMSVIMQTWTSNHSNHINGIRILGTEGNIIISDALYFNDEKMDDDVEYEDSFKNQSIAFTEYILKGIEPLSGLSDVRDTLKIIYGAYESSVSNAVIKL